MRAVDIRNWAVVGELECEYCSAYCLCVLQPMRCLLGVRAEQKEEEKREGKK